MTVPLTLVVEIEQHVRTFRADAEADDLVSTGPRWRCSVPPLPTVGVEAGCREGRLPVDVERQPTFTDYATPRHRSWSPPVNIHASMPWLRR